MRQTTRFRQLIEAPAILVLPGVHDALSAKLAAAAGFEATTMGGYAATAALLGEPDSSQLSLGELTDHYARICDAVDLRSSPTATPASAMSPMSAARCGCWAWVSCSPFRRS
jgi:2-methylisocitrate lyase-like PEP mutase family enzyme